MPEECKNVMEQKNQTNQEALEDPFQKLVVINEKKRKQVPCHYPEFFDEIKTDGWCLTCVDNAAVGDPGYCGTRMSWVEEVKGLISFCCSNSNLPFPGKILC